MKHRHAFIGLAIAWVIAGGGVMWRWTANCFGTFGEFGIGTPVGSCMPLAGLALFVWSMAGAALGLVLYYWGRRRGTSQQ